MQDSSKFKTASSFFDPFVLLKVATAQLQSLAFFMMHNKLAVPDTIVTITRST
jgi:hypothetical protein